MPWYQRERGSFLSNCYAPGTDMLPNDSDPSFITTLTILLEYNCSQESWKEPLIWMQAEQGSNASLISYLPCVLQGSY